MSLNLQALLAKFTNGDTISGVSKDDLVEMLSKISGTDTGAKKIKKSRTKSTKDPNKPKRGATAYMIWLKEKRPEIKKGLEDEHEEVPKVTEVTRKAGSIWKLLSDEDKAPYQTLAEEDKVRYTSEMVDYQPIEEYPSAPDGWSGPFDMKYLYKAVKGSDGKPMKFKSFEEAVAAARSTEECGGITKTSTGYSLRLGPDLITNPEKHRNQGLASWIKGELVVPTEMTKTSSVEDPDHHRLGPSPDLKTLFGTDSTDETRDDADDEETPVTGEETGPVTGDDEEDDEEDDEDATEVEIEEVEIDGIMYYIDEKTKTLYDPDTSDTVGTYVDGKIELN